MPTIINPLITDAGLAAAVAADGAGIQLAITHVALGSGQYTPDIGMTTMVNRKEKVTIPSGYVTGAGGFRINALFPAWAGTPNPYNATEVGFYAGDPDAGGILFAVFSHTSNVIVQRNSLDYVCQFSMLLTRVPAGSVTVTLDPGASQMLAMMADHEASGSPHAQYALKGGNLDINSLKQVALSASVTAGYGGTADALTATYAPAITALTDGMRLKVRAGYANATTTPTFSPNGITPATIVKGANSALALADIAGAGHWLDLIYDLALVKWVLLNPAHGIASGSGVPVGTTITTPATTAPSGFIKKNGALLSRTTYADLWAFAQASGNLSVSDGTWDTGKFSPGDGSTTFRIPDGRAEFLRGLDDGRGIDSGRTIGSSQLDAMQGHYHSPLAASGFLTTNTTSGTQSSSAVGGAEATTGQAVTDGTHGTPRIASETRPRNVAELVCIKY